MKYANSSSISPCVRIDVASKKPKEGAEKRRQMGKYTEEYKATIVRRMMPAGTESVVGISHETGVTTNTLYTWRKQSRAKGVVMPGKKEKENKEEKEGKFSGVPCSC